MARPKNPNGINKVCSQCLGLCKQSSDIELERCPLFRARGPDPSKLRKPLRLVRYTRQPFGAGKGRPLGTRGLKSNPRGVL